jgi:hypothetical protein
MKNLTLLTLLVSAAMFAQTDRKSDVWLPFKFFIGSWEGAAKGQSGDGKVEREYQFILNQKYLQAQNKTVYAPSKQNPAGEVHEDWGIFSYDRSRKKIVLRQFHVEGFVNQYVLDSLATDGKYITFITEGIENIAPGWRAKETYKILNDNEFIETFALAAPGKDFEVYSESHLVRKK